MNTAKELAAARQSLDAMVALLNDANHRVAKAAEDLKKMEELLRLMKQRQALAEAKANEAKEKVRKVQALTPKN
ncbi:MAG: hypothetical protein K2H70_03835 [Bacteroidales bacterium]|nr:hypothetical protein [Bacteroidales bacterium]